MPSFLDYLLGAYRASHYHQQAGRQPTPFCLPPDREMAEVVTGGRGWVAVGDGTMREVEAGDLLWHVGGDLTIGRSEPKNPYRCLSVSFQVRPGHPRPVQRFTKWEDLAELRAFTRQAVSWSADDRLDRILVAATLYGRIVTEAHRWQLGSSTSHLPEPIARMKLVIERDWQHDLPVEQLARDSGWSIQHFHAMFRRHVGSTPHQYLLDRRLQAAREMLASGEASVATIAIQAGFASSAVFCRVFRKSMGRSPGAWRRRRE